MRSIRPDLQFMEHCRTSSAIFNRLDISMELQRPAMDDLETLPDICDRADSIIASDQHYYKQQIRPVGFLWTASMFCFEFIERPVYRECGLQCIGSIFCRYPCNEKLVVQLNRRYKDHGAFIIGGTWFAFELPMEVRFKLSSLDQQVDIRFRCDDHEVAISGLPNSASNVLEAQNHYHRGQEISWKKRRLEHDSDTRPLKRARI